MDVTQRSSVEKRRVVLEKGLHHRSQLDDPVERVGHTVSTADPHVQSTRERLTEQSGLAEARRALDDDHRAHAARQKIQTVLHDGQLPVSSPQHRARKHRVIR